MTKTAVRFPVNITPDMHAALGRLSAGRGIPMSALVRMAVAAWLEQQGETGDWVVTYGSPRDADPTQDRPDI